MIKKKREKLNYFDYFIEHIDYSVEAAKLFKEFTDNFDTSKTREYEIKIHRLETKADQTQHRALSYLIKDFLPPIDRDDIVSLAQKIDDVVDHIDKSTLTINLVNIQTLRPEFSEFSTLLLKICEATKDVLIAFKNIKKYDDIQKKIIEVNKLEQKGDEMYHKVVKDLFANSKNPIEVLAWTKLYDYIETCYDNCEDIADFINQVLLKNS